MLGVSNHRNETQYVRRFHAPILSIGEPGSLWIWNLGLPGKPIYEVTIDTKTQWKCQARAKPDANPKPEAPPDIPRNLICKKILLGKYLEDFLACLVKVCQVDIYGNKSIFVIFVEGTIHWILYFNNSLLYEAATICILQT